MKQTKKKSIDSIEKFIKKNKDLTFLKDVKTDKIQIHQKQDKKFISISKDLIEEVLIRKDEEKKEFLQVNFVTGTKILLTNKYIGFAPAPCGTLDITRLPKVVTTHDLLSVIETIESILYGEENYEENFEDIKLFFESISCGAEAIGFNLAGERLWVEKLISNHPIVSKRHLF